MFLRRRNHEMAVILLKQINSEGYSRIVELKNTGEYFISKLSIFRGKFGQFGCFINPRVNEFVHS